MATIQRAIVGSSEETLEKLLELRQLNIDSAKGFEECGELVKNDRYKKTFLDIASTRRHQAEVLGDQIEWDDERETENGSYLAALHRSWIKVRDAVSSDSLQTVLDEAERGEDAIKEAYEDALSACAGSPLYTLINHQYQTVKQTHDSIRDLRDVRRSAK